MRSPVLDISGLCVRRTDAGPESAILNDVSLTVCEGETLCLVGESGSGKTMTALSIMGLLPAAELRVSAGSIRLVGEELAGKPPHRLRALRATRMAMVFQEPLAALNPAMPVGRQIGEILAAHTAMGRTERRTRTLEMLKQVELTDAERIASAYPHQLSGGQRQRVMIAMALILNPKLLIADEPTSALDVRTQQQILDLMRRLRDRYGIAILFVTHDMGVVAEIADRVAVMQQGRIIEEGPAGIVMTAARHDHTQRLLAAVPDLTPHRPHATASTEIALAAHGLSKSYGHTSWLQPRRKVPAVIDVDLTLHQGCTLGLVGESGSGKSTLARCLLRLIEPSKGRIVLGTTDIMTLSQKALTPHRRHIQIVVQDPYRSLNPRLPVADIVTEGPVNFGVPRDQALEDARGLMQLVGLSPEFLQAFPHQLSGGQRQRVALARALALKPRVLVADEAVSALDMSTQAEILRMLGELRDRLGLAILFVTHDLRTAAQICDDVAIMQGGRIVEAGAAAKVLTRPSHPYTKALLEAVPGRRWNFAASRPSDAAPAP
jgi:ABC-type glutathione transport system ATPase component